MTKEVFGLQDILKLQQKIVPELLSLLEKRYLILRTIYYNQPIGRRGLSNELGIGERIVRTEIDFLKQMNLITVDTTGMVITPEGKEVIDKLKDYIHGLKGLSELEEKIKKHLGLKDMIIVPGDMDEDKNVVTELGSIAAAYIKGKIVNDSIIALTGGSTIKEVIDNFPKMNDLKNVLVVPARGGIGRTVETLANTLVGKLANRIGASYRLLHIPDNLSDAALNTIINEKSIKEVIDFIRNADLLIFGIGKADEMAVRRGLSLEEFNKIKKMGAIGEAFGYYFNIRGEVVYSTSAIRVDYEDIKRINTIVAVAGGRHKAEAIYSVCNNNSNRVLITDEGAARGILDLIS